MNKLNEIVPSLIDKFDDSPDDVMEEVRELLQIFQKNKIRVSFINKQLKGVNLFASQRV